VDLAGVRDAARESSEAPLFRRKCSSGERLLRWNTSRSNWNVGGKDQRVVVCYATETLANVRDSHAPGGLDGIARAMIPPQDGPLQPTTSMKSLAAAFAPSR